jgi:PAS domain S-box-containing protein
MPSTVRGLVFAYGAAAVAWMLGSDWVAQTLVADTHRHVIADIAFVVVSALVLYVALARLHGERSRSAQLLETLADHSPDAIFVKDPQGRYVLFNRGAAAALNVSPEAVLDRDDRALFPTQVASVLERDAEVKRSGRACTFEETLDTANGRRTFLTTKGPLRYRDGAVGVFGIARDVTDSVQARRQLERSEQRYRLAAAGGSVWDWDIEHSSGFAQSGFWQRLGMAVPSDADAVACLTAAMHPDDRERWAQALRAHLKQRAPYDVEFRALHRDGRWRWFHTQGHALWNEQGRATYMAGTTIEITEKREAEEALQRARGELSHLLRRLMEQERDTTTRVAQSLHDRVGQLLTGARLHLDLALSQAQPQPSVGERLQHVSSLVDSSIAEVRRVLVELRPPLLQEQGLAAALDNEVRRAGAGGLSVAMALDADENALHAEWPEEVAHAAFMIAREALANALRHAQARTVQLRLRGDGRTLDLRIDDDGCGIADSERFGRPGHLGLVGMRERAASITAALAVDRRSGGGTTVHVSWCA